MEINEQEVIEKMDELEKIAKVIGYHFWKCETDQQAIRLGMDCAIEIVREIK